MSSWTRTSKAQSKIHKERSQPESRHKLGFLEKKKDYKLRAIDYGKKQDTIKALRQKALDRNPDEFYFHMVNSKIVDGKHLETKKKEESTDTQKKLLQSQNLAYVRSKRVGEQKKIERLRASLSSTFAEPNANHIYFASGSEERKELLDHIVTGQIQPGASDEAELAAYVDTRTPQDKVLAKEKKKALKELSQRIAREKELRITEQKLEVRKTLLEKCKPVKISEGTKESPAVYKWTFQRKR
ncbi:putative U3 small nucleolar RNA-associated protein 11 [Hypsibius exemplaris]|uniref:U3 small nucleolar RNA-associated protein 11 n=1 Tax=Hypsibius exemplaris TaxID=2072580 RepID=A0A1W0XAB2_HYPEX|nr:putative U3 small nucleolar RNA-associated protein 11 [Hypsibius exemplaris]